MMRHTHYIAALVAVLTVFAIGTAWALPTSNPMSSTIKLDDPDWGYSNQLTAQVTRNADNSYHYLYTLEFRQTSFDEPLTDFSVGNIHNYFHWNQGSSNSSFKICQSDNSVYWNMGTVRTGPTAIVQFWYDSWNPYGPVDVTVAGGLPSDGSTLGMILPEPGSMLALVVGLGGICWKLRRRS